MYVSLIEHSKGFLVIVSLIRISITQLNNTDSFQLIAWCDLYKHCLTNKQATWAGSLGDISRYSHFEIFIFKLKVLCQRQF